MKRKYEIKPIMVKDFNETGQVDYGVPIFYRYEI